MNKQPNAANCFICGRDNEIGLHMQFYDNGSDSVQSSVILDRRYEGYPGIIHGGILASILDEVVGRVAMVEDHHHFMMTANMTVRYRHPVPVGSKIKAMGTAVRMRKKIAKAQGQIVLADGTIACDAELTLVEMPDALHSQKRVGELGWQVDQD